MKIWKWWQIVALLLQIAGLIALVLAIATDWNDALVLPVALCGICAGNLLSLVMHIRNNRKSGK